MHLRRRPPTYNATPYDPSQPVTRQDEGPLGGPRDLDAEARRLAAHPITLEDARARLTFFGLHCPPLERADVLGLAIATRMIDHMPAGAVSSQTSTTALVRALYGFAAAAPWGV